MATNILLMLSIPIIGAILAGMTRKKTSDFIALVAISANLVITGFVITQLMPQLHLRNLVVNWPWLASSGFTNLFGYQLDPLSITMLLVIVVLGFLVVLYSLSYLSSGNKEHASSEGKERHHFFMLLFIASMIGVAISPNLLQMFFFWEMTTLCSWALISHYRNDESLKAGFKALLMTFSGGLFFALALVILFVKTKSFDFSALDQLSPTLRGWVFFFFIIAAWAKSAQIPFYTWLPDAMAAPTTVSMFLHAASMVKAGVFLIARIGFDNPGLAFSSGLLLAIMAVFTMLISLYLFFFQDDLKRLLAYSTIAHLAYILFGVGLGIMGSQTGFNGGVMHIMNHGVGKGLLFLVVGVISYSTGTRSITRLSGLARTSPLVGIAFFVGMLAILGIPPFSGFWSKFYLLTGAIQVGGWAGYFLLIPFLLEIIVAFAWFLHVGHRVFFGQVSPEAATVNELPLALSIPLILMMILTVVAPFVALSLISAF